MYNPRYYQQMMGFGQYPDEADEDAPVPPALPVPECRCGVPAWVTQSRHRKTAARAYYCCWNKFVLDPRKGVSCYFFQWIDGKDKFDPRIRLFPYIESTEIKPYNEFCRWVPPPPNPPPMSSEEKDLAAIERVSNPPFCHCGVRAEIQRPNVGVPIKFAPFFRCSLKSQRGWPRCDFNEFLYGPRAEWPTEAEVREFESGEKPWPYETWPPSRCKCGILATEGVVPSELGFGKFCGNAYGEYWEGRTCDWETFRGRHELMLELGATSEPWKRYETEKIRKKVRREYGVPLPEDEDIDGPIYDEMVRETGQVLDFEVGSVNYEKILAYWRRNRERFMEIGIRPLTSSEKAAKRQKKEDEWEAWKDSVREKRRREMQERAEEAQMEAMRAAVANLPTDLPNVGGGDGMDEAAREAQLEAIKASKKGKGVLVDDVGTSRRNVRDDDCGDD